MALFRPGSPKDPANRTARILRRADFSSQIQFREKNSGQLI